ncbi:multidrug effflux MFS transporter [Variovorax guangxiensis]|uniref:Bcr/CflA family efflux transporter n=1 Tax=Variovorax guangxiensis TaxID=1775474 RepID=A0A502DHI7_9BURK|nr:multidrug effflux MFS transporter [Variovorax guangxiensis]TPG17474.1 Bcr/CflA family efflux MFS transporter [Variovorax ginsengisoli]TPG23561.1 Bcr/CflA family efflux MFS transporter [Variovorax guangxiensis]
MPLPAPERPAEAEPPERRLAPLWLLSALPAVGLFASSAYLPSLPAMARDFGVPTGQVQLTVTAYLAAMAAFMLVVGPWSDRIGRRRIGLCSLVVFFVGSVAAWLSPSVGWLLVARVVQGIGASSGMVLSRAMVRDAMNDHEAARANAQMGMSIALAPIVAPMIGGLVQQAFGWRANLLLFAVLGLALCIASVRGLVETLPPHRRHAQRGWRLLSGYLQLLRTKRFMANTLPVAIGGMGIFAYNTQAPVLLVGDLHVSAAAFGVYGALPPLGYVLGNFLTTRWTGRVPQRKLIERGCSLLALSGTLVVLLGWMFGPIAPLIAGPMLLFGLGNGLLMPTASLRSMSVVPTLVGSSAALSGGMRMGAGSLGSLLVVTLAVHDGATLGMLVGTMGLLSLACFLLLSRGES